MDISQDSNCLAFTLPPEDDWGPVRLNTTARLAFYPFDINCLAADMGAYVTKRQEPFGPNRPLHLEATPETRGLVACEHPEPGKFSVVPLLKPDDIFDLVICDARVFLGNLELQDSVEVDRMQLVQLALGLEHVRPGGKMVIRLARIESWSAVDLIHRFSQFSTLEIFKHFDVGTKWPDCYLVASNIRSKQTEAINAVSFWKQA
ncbi:hypothetical protein RRF57_011424 [Xylaria bambusicola]|uniref:Uncharacterized protein n=1 Tax=Xylaria bambusicola TaxID=326684 RepID=A0AAN7UTS5_9PEZI